LQRLCYPLCSQRDVGLDAQLLESRYILLHGCHCGMLRSTTTSAMRFRGGVMMMALTMALWTAAVVAANIPDADAEDQRLGSVYIGTLTASWTDGAHDGCTETATVADAQLTFGPPRISGAGAGSGSGYFLSLLAASDSFTAALTSSVTPDAAAKDAHAWWTLAAKRLDGAAGYTLSGTLAKASAPLANQISGTAASPAACGLPADGAFAWGFAPRDAAFSGTATANAARLAANGSYTSADRKHRISYSFAFAGTWDGDSAALDTDAAAPAWSNPSRTTTAPTTTPTTTGLQTDTATTPSFVFTGTLPMATVTSAPASPSTSAAPTPAPSKLGRGGIAGITVGAVSALVAVAAIAWWAYSRYQARREENQVYPELAYLYTPSPGPYSQASVYDVDYHGGGGGGGYSSPPPVATAYQGGGGMRGDWERQQLVGGTEVGRGGREY
ncbi:hypothetical protein EDC01DRAFT_760195, partial [Geopyxis carbonaria]